MSSETSAPQVDLAAMTSLRPSEIKTYHKSTYDRISPSTTFDGRGKTVLVTAGGGLTSRFRITSACADLFSATGVGLAIAEGFAKAGVEHLVILQRRQAALDEAEQILKSKYPSVKVTKYAASVTDLDRISSILKELGRVDVLAANAGMSHPFVPTKDLSTADFQSTFDVNVVATFHIIKEFLALESFGPRQVIHTSSSASQMLFPGTVGYGPSKTAANLVIQHFATENAAENADRDVTIQTFHPGVIYTESAAKTATKDTFDWEDGKCLRCGRPVEEMSETKPLIQRACRETLQFGSPVQRPSSSLAGWSGHSGMLKSC